MEIQSSNNRSILIDSSDINLVKKYKWAVYKYSKGLWYATSHGNSDSEVRTTYMHRLITGAKKGEYVDHIDGNGLNNRRDNLRITTQGVNLANAKSFAHNTSGHRGVILFRGWYRAQVKHNRKALQSGNRPSKKDAAILRDEMARRIWGDNIYLNFPDEIPSEEIKEEATRLLAKRDWLDKE